MEITTRQEAAEKGYRFFNTGKSCKNGHNPLRYTSTGICVKCCKENNSKVAKVARGARMSMMTGNFIYPLHPDDFLAALAYCHALDMQRGRVPKLAEAGTRPPITPEAIQERRAWLLNQTVPKVQPHLPAP